MVCKNCGTNNLDTSKFCASCGSPLEQVVASEVVQPIVQNQIPVNPMQPATKPTVDIKRFVIVGLLFAIVMMMVIVVILMTKPKDGVGLPKEDDGSISRTIMIYMVGADLESKSGIATADLNGINSKEIDLENTKILLYTGGTEEWHNFASNNENAIYELTINGFEKKKTYNKEDMGDPSTLSTFLNYSYDNYKTDEYDLLFYNHGGAIDGAIYDEFTNDNLSIKDMSEALENSPFKGDNKIEVITFRTCLNGTLELASQLDQYADYLVASEEVTNGSNTSSVLSYLNHIEVSDSAIDYGKKFITEYEKHIDEIDPFGMGTSPMYSLIDLSKVDKVVSELNTFIEGVDLAKSYADVIRVRGTLYQYGYSLYGDARYDMVDLYTLVNGIDDYSSVSSDALISSINDAVIFNWAKSNEQSKGLSIYFPYKGSTLDQAKYIGVYNEIDFSESYKTFIKKISSLVRSNKSSNFSNTDISNNTSSVTKGEFTLELSNEQASDFAEAFYMVFEKEDDGLFMPIYSSDNAYLEGNKVKTKVTNNLIKIVDHTDESSAYLQLTERSKAGVKSYRSTGVAYYFGNSNDLSEFEVEAVNLHIDYDENGSPYVANTSIINSDDSTISTRFVDLEHFDYIQFTNYRYGILDSNGNYNPNWESSDTKYLFEVNTKSDYELVNVSLDDGDYYAIFCVTDIYGNSFYSNLVSVNK